MRRKMRLVVSIIIFMLVGILVGLGMWAVLGGDIGIGGDIYFSSEALEMTINGKLFGHRRDCMTEDTAEILKGVTWTKETIQDGIENELDWTGLNLTFADKNTPITIKVEIRNNSDLQTGAKIGVGVSNKTDTKDKNFTVDITNYGTNIKDEIKPGETITYLIVLNIVNYVEKVDGELNVIFSFSSIY